MMNLIKNNKMDNNHKVKKIKRVIERPNTALTSVPNNNANLKEDNKLKTYDADRSRQLLQKIKSINDNLKQSLKSYKIRDIEDIKIASYHNIINRNLSLKAIDKDNMNSKNNEKRTLSLDSIHQQHKQFISKKTKEQIENKQSLLNKFHSSL